MNRWFPPFLSLALLASGLALVEPGNAAPRFCARTGTLKLDNKISLSGTVFAEMWYGPPGYGENPKSDEKMHPIFLKLDDSLRVDRKDRGDGFAEISTIIVRDIQLAPVHSKPPPVGKHVVVEGSLFGAETGYHHRPVLMELSSFHVGGRIGCDGSEVR